MKIFSLLPEMGLSLFLMLVVVDRVVSYIKFGTTTTDTLFFSVVALVFLGLLIKQYFRWSAALAVVLAIPFLLGSSYMFLALISEFSEFPASHPDRFVILLWGIPLIGTFLVLATAMLLKGLKPFFKKFVFNV